jgi:serine protease Do
MAPTEFRVHFGTDTVVPAEAVGLDRGLNLAFVRIDPDAAPPLSPAVFQDGPALQVGDPVVIVGVLGRKYGFAPALYRATVNAVVEEPVRLYGVDTVVQDLAVGGLVLRSDGTTAGVIANDLLRGGSDNGRAPGNFLSIIASTGQPQVRRPGYAMILPFAAFREAMDSPPPIQLTTGRRRGWVGIVMQALNEDLIQYWGLPVPGGIIVGSVLEGSPAEAAGLRPGDILTRFGGDPLRINENSQLADFRRRVEAMKADDVVDLQVYREGRPVTIALTLGNAPKTAGLAEDYEDTDFGLKVRELTLDVRQALNLEPGVEGIVVESTEDSGWADVAGLAPRDIILELDGAPVRTVSRFREALDRIKERRGQETVFFVLRPPETRFVRLKTDYDRSGRAGGE